jgi:UDP-glucose 4-epimerase
MKQRILVVGGAGYVGSHVVKWLQRAGHDCVTADNLSTGHRELVQSDFIELDLTDAAALESVFSSHSFDVVVHLAAKSLVGESVSKPDIYYEQNVGGMLNLLTCMAKYEVSKLIFSSTCAVYSESETPPFTENSNVDPASCYGRTKLACEYMIRDFSKATGLNAVLFRYFNVAGADPEAEIGEWHDPETHLIPLCFKQVLEKTRPLSVFGTDYDTPDGTCIRDYIHVNDIAVAHEKALAFLSDANGVELFNLGTGSGLSVKDIIDSVQRISGQTLAFEYCDRRAGDVPRLVADYSKAKQVLDWTPSFSKLESLLEDAWRWHQKVHDRI